MWWIDWPSEFHRPEEEEITCIYSWEGVDHCLKMYERERTEIIEKSQWEIWGLLKEITESGTLEKKSKSNRGLLNWIKRRNKERAELARLHQEQLLREYQAKLPKNFEEQIQKWFKSAWVWETIKKYWVEFEGNNIIINWETIYKINFSSSHTLKAKRPIEHIEREDQIDLILEIFDNWQKVDSVIFARDVAYNNMYVLPQKWKRYEIEHEAFLKKITK